MIQPYLHILPSGKRGSGVFTSQLIAKGTVIEIAPVILMGAADRVFLDQTLLHDYIFEWGTDKSQCCMALGYVPIYNHSYKSNCIYEMDYQHNQISIIAVSNINKGEELFINYNGDWNDPQPLWFDAI
jgi:SET domain-containing protein